MNTISTHEIKGQTYTITIKPPFTDIPHHAGEIDGKFTVEVTDTSHRRLYTGAISCLFAPYFKQKYKTTIPDFLTNSAKAFLDNRFK